MNCLLAIFTSMRSSFRADGSPFGFSVVCLVGIYFDVFCIALVAGDVLRYRAHQGLFLDVSFHSPRLVAPVDEEFGDRQRCRPSGDFSESSGGCCFILFG